MFYNNVINENIEYMPFIKDSDHWPRRDDIRHKYLTANFGSGLKWAVPT